MSHDNSRTPVLYALESLPALIGERQFTMLTDALGLTDALRDQRQMLVEKLDAGVFVAEAIQRMAESRRSERRRQSASQTSVLEGF